MNRFSLIVLCTVGIIFVACDGPVNVKAECTILDMDNKPLKNRKVDLFSIFNKGNFDINRVSTTQELKETKMTDQNGKVIFEYTWQSMDATAEYFHIVAQDDSLLKSINHLTPPLGKKSFSGIIQMDSLVPFKVRFKTNRSDCSVLRIEIMNNAYLTSPQNLSVNTRIFADTTIKNISPKLDTTVTIKVYKKADFMSWNLMSFTNEPKLINNNLLLIKQNTDRNAVFLQEF